MARKKACDLPGEVRSASARDGSSAHTISSQGGCYGTTAVAGGAVSNTGRRGAGHPHLEGRSDAIFEMAAVGRNPLWAATHGGRCTCPFWLLSRDVHPLS